VRIKRIYRRLRFGDPVVIVSGLPRSGTSMMMQMLEAGGMPVVSDYLRVADESNPQGYYELERVKELDKGGDTSWVRAARGSAVKIIGYLLRFLPQDVNYRVVLLQRDISEILASQTKMLAARGEASDIDDDRMRELFAGHVAQTYRLLQDRACFEFLEVSYRTAVDHPEEVAGRVSAFLEEDLDIHAMATIVNPELYRNRALETA
jgi:hypothetical protein